MKIREKIIVRMNREFGLTIPIDTPIKSHQKGFKDCGGQSWWFDSKDTDIRKYGSSFTMTQLLKNKNWCLFEDGEIIEVIPSFGIRTFEGRDETGLLKITAKAKTMEEAIQTAYDIFGDKVTLWDFRWIKM